MIEFTGERVIPGQVESDLWNEHLSRYLFAARLAAGKRVLDAGCGSGYGTAELARTSLIAFGLDNSAEAVAYANGSSRHPRLSFLRGSCCDLPFASSSLDLVVCFEVIEHVATPERVLAEAKRVLCPHGQLVISTPNKAYYAETRVQSGPNPFHETEFSYDEFRELLETHFSHVSFFVQNHSSALVFQPLRSEHACETLIADDSTDPDAAHFLIAVCAQRPQVGAPSFVFVPQTANVLREREQHIALLESELAQKDRWLQETKAALEVLHKKHQALTAELVAANRWAGELDEKLKASGERILELQDEVASRNEWVVKVQRELDGKLIELQTAVDVLHTTEEALKRTQEAYLATRDEFEKATAKLRFVRDSRWVRLGRSMGVGPDLTQEKLE